MILELNTAFFMVAGIYVLAYGLSAMRYSRWDHGANAKILLVFHLWAILVGIVVIG